MPAAVKLQAYPDVEFPGQDATLVVPALVELSAGDTVTVRTEITETWPSRTKPLGFVRRKAEMLNQHGEVVLTVIGVGMFSRRSELGEPPPARRADQSGESPPNVRGADQSGEPQPKARGADT